MRINVNALFDALAKILERKENVTIRVNIERREKGADGHKPKGTC